MHIAGVGRGGKAFRAYLAIRTRRGRIRLLHFSRIPVPKRRNRSVNDWALRP